MTPTVATIRAALDAALPGLRADQLEELAGVLKVFELRVERHLRTPMPALTTSTGLLTAEQIAAELNIKPSAVREWGRAGRIPVEHLGRFVRYDLAAVRRAMADNSKCVRLGTQKNARHIGRLSGPISSRLPAESAQEGPPA